MPAAPGPARGRPRRVCLTLPSAKAAGFSVHRAVLPVGSLTGSPRAFSVSVCPAATSLSPSASMFLLALRSLSWCVPQETHSHVLSESFRFGFSAPHSEHSFVDGKKRPTLTLCRRFHAALYWT